MKNVLATVSLLLSFPVAAETTVVCPLEYPVKLINAQPPPGWKGIAHAPDQWMNLKLITAGVIAGNPKDWAQASQIGEETPTSTGVRIKFRDLNAFVEPQPKWIYCMYATDPRIQLLQQIPYTTDVCVADVRRNGKTVKGITMKCR